MVADANEPIPLLELGIQSVRADDTDSEQSVNSHSARTGTAWTAVAHIITGVIGSGVLSLAWSMAQLGWIWGPLLMVFFASVTLVSTFLLCNSYRSPDPDNGPIRNKSYIDAVRNNLGTKSAWVCGLLIQMNLYGTAVAYTITTALCLSAIQTSSCYHKYGQDAPCESGNTQYMLFFGAVQVFMSQIPDFHSMEWLSVIAAIMSLAYSLIGLGLGAAKVIDNKVIEGSTYGVSTSTTIQKVWQVSQAVGDIAFAYPYCIIVLEIQDTLKSPPSERQTMKKASVISICITTFFYLSCGGLGYAAFGDKTPGDLLTGFSTYGPYWLINFANACVVLHLIGGYQVYSQPVFAVVDKWLSERFPQSSFVNRNYNVKLPLVPALSLNFHRLCFRTVYVASTTAVAMLLPYFNQVLGVLGTINFWPLSIYFPVEMWLRQQNIGSWTPQWIFFRTSSILCFLLNMYMLAGSIQGILAARFTKGCINSVAIITVDRIRSSPSPVTVMVGMEIGGDDQHTSLLSPSPSSYLSCGDQAAGHHGHKTVERSGNIWTALAHIITAVIGSGVLSLAWSMSRLGWIAGPLTMLAFSSVTLTSAVLLCNCYISADLDNGLHRNGSYLDAVRRILGKKSAWVCGIIVRINFIKVGIVYTITSSISMRAIQRSNCYHSEGHTAACKYGTTCYMLIFGIIQVIVSQIPDFRNTEWLSVVAAVMSFTYSIIGSALGLANVIENREIKGSIKGVPTPTAAQKVWSVSQAIGDIAFAFPFSLIFLEIMDTLKSNPPEKVTMKKASVTAVCVTTFFYLCCGGLGYAAFGNSTPGNLLTGFGFYEPYWLIDFANACVVLHLIGGYQVFTQPLYASIEQWFAEKFPNNKYVHGDLKQMPALRLNLLRLCLRTAYVGFTTGFAMLFPYFNQVVGLAGAINFWPVVVYFPVEMYLVQKEIGPWTSKSIILRIYCFITLLIILFALVGSIKGLLAARFS
ncbi:putative amino acid permease 7 [Sesamum alatum]|uniref:Amino acid permease 7 n=1 Tax=Sesamum alatum TaxID=300844 RepID=A0AAE1YZP1_9LAMI|nr:putative amino acid permease 7 [Sesamum alatum]